MTAINQADAVRYGTAVADKVMAAGVQIWPGALAEFDYAWHGAEPTPGGVNFAYTLGTFVHTASAVVFHGIRIWNPGLVAPDINRTARLWSIDGNTGANPVVQRTVDLPEVMPAGWSQWLFATPVPAPANTWWCPGYYTNGYWAYDSDYGVSGFAPTTVGPITLYSSHYGDGDNFPAGDAGGTYYAVDILWLSA